MIREEWFPTPIYFETGLDVSNLLEPIHTLQSNSDGVIASNYGGWQSKDISKMEDFKDIIQTIENKTKKIKADLFPDMKEELKVDNIWANINNKHDFNYDHIHPHSILSGCLYVKYKKGNIVFEDPRYPVRANEEVYIPRPNRLTFFNVNYEPEDGKLILFPSWLRHKVLPNTSDEERISIAFNMRLI